jgi:parallel beta-helix repeat protein
MKRIVSLILFLILSLSLSGQRILSGPETWSGTHNETDNVLVPVGITLTISPGTTVKFSLDKSLKVSGTLHAGNSDASGASINFTTDDASWGHIYLPSATSSWIKNCEIEKGNTTNLAVSYGGNYGGAISATTSNLVIEKCNIHNNTSLYGGGIFVTAGCSPEIKNCSIYSNTATGGGAGIYIHSNSNSIVSNCLIYSNSCSGYGGGGIMISSGNGSSRVINCVIANNTTTGSGRGIYILSSNSAKIINSIIWGNGSGNQIFFDGTVTSVMENCGVQGVLYSTCLNLNASNTAPTGPNFVATDGTNWALNFVSPCIDFGIDNSTDPNVPLTDYLGNSRVGKTDIGAYENNSPRWHGTDATNPTLWSVANNWSTGSVPTGSENVMIPRGLTNYPTGSSSQSFTIGSGKSLIIDAGAKATFGTLTNNGTLNLISDATGNYSLIVSTYSGNNATISQFLTGGGTKTPSTYKWHYISTPVTSIPVSTYAPGTTLDLAQYLENRPSISLLQGWVAYDGYVYSTGVSNGPTFSTLTPGKGYDFWDNQDNTFTFSGQLNTGNVSVSLSYTSGNDAMHGFNLLGNPFSSGLKWDDIINSVYFTYPVSTSKALYFTRNNVQCSYVAGVGTPSDVNGIIPPMQGFFNKTHVSGGTITLPAAARSQGNIHATYKGESIIPLVRLAILEDSVSFDETVVRFDVDAKPDLDDDFDAMKMFLDDSTTAIYSVTSSVKYAINGQPYPETYAEYPIVVNVVTDSVKSLKVTQLQGLDLYDVKLKDNVTGLLTDLVPDIEIPFSAAKGTLASRFTLIVETPLGINDTHVKSGGFNIYRSMDMINIMPQNNEWEGEKATINVIDLTGRIVRSYSNVEFEKDIVKQFAAPAVKGLYLINIQSGKMRYSGKVMIN